ncbi:sugar kinase [Pararhizobium mangrovi]|uniref:Sugar kinase n=1 Tax=Pararhizobium mangrovi TaxID=2590452 RepID=A0A506UI00_9HYPH|nr:sugar kinase [Pararhizobium mangrovi]TPW32930.1 sugar kinase [Pararhizobium mangrovi]
MSRGTTLTSIGECMIEFSRTAEDDVWRRNFAGDTFNTAWYFSRLAPDGWKTAYFTAVGDDAPSRDLERFIAANGISTEFVRRVANASPGLYLIELENAERHFSYWREASAARRLAADREHLANALAASGIAYFSGITLAILPEADRAVFIDELARAREAGTTVAFDPNLRPRLWPGTAAMTEAIDAAAAVSTIVFPTFEDDAAAFGDANPAACARRYRDRGAETVIVKNGAEPCLAVEGETTTEEPAVRVAAPVDTTGAGDSFNAAFLASRLSGAPLGDALKAAHATAANTIAGYGALVP